jgi:hypothetical protein
LSESKENGIKKDALKQESDKGRQEPVKLDQIVKLLFEVSKDLLVKTLNALFKTDFDVESIDIDKIATELVTDDFDLLHADIFIKITQDKENPHIFHIEIQTKPDDMAFRTIEYALMKSISNYRQHGKTNGETILYTPKSIIIQIDGGSSVPEEKYVAKVANDKGEMLEFSFPVLRYFDYSKDKLISEHLYVLLPLQIYRLRSELDRMTKKGDEQARQKAIIKAQKLTETITKDIIKLNKRDEISSYDMNRILLALQELFAHLNNRYQVNSELNTEVRTMMRTLIDENMLKKLSQAEEQAKQREEQRAEEIAKSLIGILDVKIIAEKTKLPLDKVKEFAEAKNKQ